MEEEKNRLCLQCLPGVCATGIGLQRKRRIYPQSEGERKC